MSNYQIYYGLKVIEKIIIDFAIIGAIAVVLWRYYKSKNEE